MEIKTLLVLILSTIIVHQNNGQDLVIQPRPSQRSTISQRIGTTDISIVYHSPLAKGRTIFGGLLPYDFVVEGVEYPWRAGSNENTTVQFSHDVMIEGQSLPKGTYGLHILVYEKKWTFIFSNNNSNWGSFHYNPEEDALRVEVEIEKTAHQEWLSYNFIDRESDSAVLELHWADTRGNLKINTIVAKNIVEDIQSKEEKTENENYILVKQLLALGGSSLDESLRLVNHAIEENPFYSFKLLKADVLSAMGREAEAKKLTEEALVGAKGYGWSDYALSFYKNKNDRETSYKLISHNLTLDSKDYVAHMAMGQLYLLDKNFIKATEHLKLAYENCTDRYKDFFFKYNYLSNKVSMANKRSKQ